MTRTKPVPATQQARDRIAYKVARGHLTIDQAHAELDRLERPPGVPLSKPDKCKHGLPSHFPCTVCRWDREDAAEARTEKPGCFEARAGLKHEVVAEMDAITMRTLLAAGMVR